MSSQPYIDINLAGTGISDNVITNDLQLFFQEVQLALSVGPDGSWGSRDSIDITKYLFNQYVTVNQIQNEIDSFITAYCSQAGTFQHSIDVSILKVNSQDLIYIVMTVYPAGANRSFVQKYLLGSDAITELQ
jgi:hypothetical protein